MIFTNAFALNSVLTPAFAISFILIVHFIFQKKIVYERPPYLFFFWLLLTFSFIVMSNGEKSLNHWFLWTFPFFSYYFVFKNELFQLFTLSEIKNKIFKYITYVTLLACSFSILEFCCINFLDIDLSFIPRGAVEDYKPFDFGFVRARSFAEESGHFSFFVEIFGPLSVYWINQNLRFPLKLIALAIILLGLIVTLSGVGLLLLVIYLFMLFYSYLLRRKTSTSFKIKVIFYAIGLFFLILVIYPDFFSTVWNLIAVKTELDNESYLERVGRFAAIDKLSGFAFLIGYGPASFSTLNVNSFISLYLGILMNTGILGIILYALFCLTKYKSIIRIKDIDCRLALKCSFLFSCFHLAFIDIIYVPWFWVLLSLIDVIYKKERKLVI
ncbi:MAG: hypothetical protein RL070_1122 [Bacteroidota bacterium]|jgi:hypothetical protein